MECEICGRREAVCIVELEGAKLNACAGCARGGKIEFRYAPDHPPKSDDVYTPPPRTRSEEAIVDGYGKLIRNAREKTGLTAEALGQKLNERASYIEHVEKEQLLPSITLARKLEKSLKIQIVVTEQVATEPAGWDAAKKSGQSLFDVAKIEDKSKKK
jgi:putative transcription factor